MSFYIHWPAYFGGMVWPRQFGPDVQLKFIYKISNPKYAQFIIKIRKPSWVTKVITNESYVLENDFIVIDRSFQTYPFYVTESTLNDWLKRMDKVLEAATWHYVNKKYDLPYEFATGSVVL